MKCQSIENIASFMRVSATSAEIRASAASARSTESAQIENPHEQYSGFAPPWAVMNRPSASISSSAERRRCARQPGWVARRSNSPSTSSRAANRKERKIG